MPLLEEGLSRRAIPAAFDLESARYPGLLFLGSIDVPVSLKTLRRGLFALAAFAGIQSAGAADIASLAPSDVPPGLETPHHEVLVAKALGVGVQIYTCGPSKDDPQQYVWNFNAPEATLFDAGSRRIGKHYAGPSWEANDGSKIVGTVKAHADSPSGSAIPWLLLTTRSTDKSGTFAKVRSVQRLHTVAGIAPSMPCGATTAGRVARVPYTADYYFYEAAH
jgi:Protein of unknown function (DUF3455)